MVASSRALPQGLIFEIARAAGLTLFERGGKAVLCCPFHCDRNASAFVSKSNVFFCSVCTPDGGWSAKRFAAAVGQPWGCHVNAEVPRPTRAVNAVQLEPTFSPADALRTWTQALARARDADAVGEDRQTHEYLELRRLMPACEFRAFGVLVGSANLHPAIANWPRSGYRIVAPLYDSCGNVVNTQARGLPGCTPKTRVPKGCRISGTVFADSRGRRVLSGQAEDASTVVFGEGMTDCLALTIASPFAVLTAPGTSNACKAVGPWALDRRVLLALDNDEAGNMAVAPAARALYSHGATEVARVAWPQGAKDACGVLEAFGAQGLHEFLLRASVGRVA